MGLWDWIFGTTKRSTAPRHAQRSDAGAVALDEPDGATPDPLMDGVAPWWAPEEGETREPSEASRPVLSPDARALEDLLVTHFDGHDLSMPPLPRVPALVLRHLKDPRCDFGRVADDISEDPVIAAAVLRMSNSPVYRGLDRTTALKPAITRLGAKAIRALMMHQSLRAATFQQKGAHSQFAERLWCRSQASAWTMRGLAPFTPVDQEDAFLYGLLHDIGNVMVLRVACSHEKVTHARVGAEALEHLCLETHQEFGELIADEWQLPSALRTLVSDHHCHPAPDDPLRDERLLLLLTDMTNAMLGYTPPADYRLLETRAVADLGLSDRDDFVDFLGRLPGELEASIAWV